MVSTLSEFGALYHKPANYINNKSGEGSRPIFLIM